MEKTNNKNYDIEFKKTAKKIGLYSNAFRIKDDPDTPSDCFLDFLITSPTEEKAFVISRVRVRKEFLYELAGYFEKNFGLRISNMGQFH